MALHEPLLPAQINGVAASREALILPAQVQGMLALQEVCTPAMDEKLKAWQIHISPRAYEI